MSYKKLLNTRLVRLISIILEKNNLLEKKMQKLKMNSFSVGACLVLVKSFKAIGFDYQQY